MPKQYTGLGLSLLYPDTWSLTEDLSAESRQGIMLESPGGSFLSINRLASEEEADASVDEVVQAMANEYEDVESEPLEIEIAGQVCSGTVQRFYYLDFVVASQVFTVESPDNGLYLIQIQGEDRDMDQQAPVFEAILTSMIRSLVNQ